MQQQLARFAIQADTFEQGRALLQADAKQPYDLLFIDQMMPRPDGTLLLRILRRRDRQRGRQAMRVLCSADAQLLSQSPEAGERVMIKPVQLADLSALLAEWQEDPLATLDDNLRHLAQQNDKFLSRLSQTLHSTVTQDLAVMREAHERADWTQFAEAAHRMKGSCLLAGLEHGAQLSQQLTEQVKQHQDTSETWQSLILFVNRLLKKLESYGTYPHS